MLERLQRSALDAALPVRRAAFIVNAYPVLSETFVMYAALGLIRRGWSVDIVPVHQSQADGEGHPVAAELARSVRVLRPGFDCDGAGEAAGATLRNLMRRHGLAALRTMDPIRFARATFTLRPLYLAETLSRHGPYDVVHCHWGTLAGPVLELRRAGLFDARVVVHFRGYDMSRFVEIEGAQVYDTVFAEADWFIANSRHFRDRAIELGCDPGRIDVVPSGCDLARFPFRARRLGPGEPVRLLAIGRLVEKKGHGVAIEAVRRLTAAGRDVRLRIVGEGPMRDALAAAAADLGGRVELAGALAHHAIAEELARAHIVLAPSLCAAGGDQDGPVNTVKEAMASGAPVVASRHGGIPELIEHGVSGLLCGENDAEDLAARIDEMIAASAHWPAFGRAARRTVEARFSLEVATDKLLAAYDSSFSQPQFAHVTEYP